jgi:hypothetical protein
VVNILSRVSGTGRGRSKMAKSSHWPHIKCDLGPVGLIQDLYRAVSDRIIADWVADLVLLGGGRA